MGMTDALSGVGGALGGIFGYALGGEDRKKATDLLGQARAGYDNLDPRIQAQLAQAQQAGPSAYGSMQVDPQTREDQLAALSQLKDIYSQGGMDASARADIAGVQQQANQNAQALNANIQNQMAQRGMASSGANYAAQRAAAQNQANQAGMQGMQALAMGQQRQMGALQGAAGLAGQIHGQDYQQASDKAQAQDILSRFNAANSTQNNQFNATQGQNAQVQTYNNAFNKTNGTATAIDKQADDYTKKAQAVGDFAKGLGTAAGGAAGVIGFGGM